MRWGSIALKMLISAAALLVCGTALAQNQPVNGFVIINPISVCTSTGSSCAPYGVSCTSTSGKPVCTQSPAPSLATVNTPIGFVDADTNINLTRAFWAQAGLDVVFFPIRSYNSPANTIPRTWNNIKDPVFGTTLTSGTGGNYVATDYRTLHLVNVPCANDNFIALTSPDFQALTQHPICTEHGGLGPGYTTLVNPPPPPSPAPPLAINGCSTDPTHPNCSSNSNAIDVFFVNGYGGTAAASPTQYGFSWINGDGASVQQQIFQTSSLLKTAPRYDTVAHEIGHALGLTHANFGLPITDTTLPAWAQIDNLMQLGTTRATSYLSGCQGLPLSTFTNFSSGPPPIYNNGALYDLDLATSNPCGAPVGGSPPLADQLIQQPAGTVCSSLLDPNCTTQIGAAAVSPFINKIAPNTANAGGGTCAPFCAPSVAATSTTTSATSTTNTSGTPAPIILTISAGDAPNDGSVSDLASSIIVLPPNAPLSFSGSRPIAQIGGTPIDSTQPCDPSNLRNCAVQVTSITKLSNQQVTGNPGCDSGTGQPPSSQCIKVTYSTAAQGLGFGPDNPYFNPNNNPPLFVVLAVNFNKDAGTIGTQNLLAGAQYTSIYSNGFATTSLFGNANAAGFFKADAQSPDLTTPNVLLDPKNFQNASAVTPPFGDRKLALCSPPFTTVFVKIKNQLVPKMVCPDGNLPDGPD